MTAQEELNRTIFRAVAKTQDEFLASPKYRKSRKLAIRDARGHVAAEFAVPVREVKFIEDTGVEGDWPPFDA